MSTAASPLGRYATPAGDAPVTVVLLGVPVRVLVAAQEHHDGLQRELRLLAMSGTADPQSPADRLVRLVRELGVRYAGARARPDAEADAAARQDLDAVDLTYRVPPSAATAVRELESLMADADELCRSGRLISLPRTPVLARFGHWYLSQFADQVAGKPPTAWDGPLDPD